MEAKEFEEALNDLESKLDRVRALYENWFRGYERMEPRVPRKAIERRVYQLRKEQPRNTGLRFRYNMLFQRYTTLSSYWMRTAKQIEEGTHRLQRERLKRRKRRKEEPAPETQRQKPKRDTDRPRPQAYELDLNEQFDVSDLLDDSELDEVARAVKPVSLPPSVPPGHRAFARATFARPAVGGSAPRTGQITQLPPKRALDESEPDTALRPLPDHPQPAQPPRVPRPRGAPPPPPGAAAAAAKVPRPRPAASGSAAKSSAGAGPDDQQLKKLYTEYSNARRLNNEGNVRYDALVSSINRMMPELQKRHAGKRIDFEVVVKNGRVGLKPKPTT